MRTALLAPHDTLCTELVGEEGREAEGGTQSRSPVDPGGLSLAAAGAAPCGGASFPQRKGMGTLWLATETNLMLPQQRQGQGLIFFFF